MRELRLAVDKKNAEKITHAFNRKREKEDETTVARECFERFKLEIGGDLGWCLASVRDDLRKTFEKGTLEEKEKNFLRDLETLYQHFLLYEKHA